MVLLNTSSVTRRSGGSGMANDHAMDMWKALSTSVFVAVAAPVSASEPGSILAPALVLDLRRAGADEDVDVDVDVDEKA